MSVEFVEIESAGRRLSIEHEWIAPEQKGAPLIVFLHEGLGSLAMWKDFPARLCEATGCRGLVYSRPGYGWSTPREEAEHWPPDFMHRQAFEVLPALLKALGVNARVEAGDKPWLFGHSDGGSIALLYAARFPQALAGAVVMAPHILVEDVSVRSIAQAKVAYETTDLRARLAKYHADPDSAFWGWNRIWLDPEFRHWRITEALGSIVCPLLAIQGVDDEYGTLEQVHGIARRVPQAQVVELPQCGHSPHKDQPDAVLAAVRPFIARATAAAA